MTATPTDLLNCIDIGANLTSRQFRKDVDSVIQEARSAGVVGIVLTGSSEKNSLQAVSICTDYPNFLYSTAGIHPHDAKEFDPVTSVDSLRTLSEKEPVIAVGECGLDFNRDFSPRDQQRVCFAAHLNLAAETKLPLFLHERDAHDEFVEMMRECRDSISQGVVHCFTGTIEQAKIYLDLDLHLGITGWICDERRGQHLREVVQSIPLNRLMIETDAPYLAPRDIHPKIQRNEPKYLLHILKTVAACRGEDPQAIAPKIVETTCNFFQIPPPLSSNSI